MWIDALCINQEDLDERSEQVNFMWDIYRGAEKVVVWLGEDPGFASDAISLIRRVAHVARKDMVNDHIEFPKFRDRENGTIDELPGREDAIWRRFAQFYANVWFQRIWVIQEVAGENVVMIWGHQKISLEDAGLSLRYIFSKGYIQRGGRQITLAHSSLMLSLRRGNTLHELLNGTSLTQATDSRDKIYALLGLYSKWLNDLGLPNCSLKPDYKKTIPEVYGDEFAMSLPCLAIILETIP
jgi:hypothetical protein